MTKFYMLSLLAMLVFAGCKTASKAYNKGDYADAIELGVKKIQKDPGDTETLSLIAAAYTYAVNQHQEQIRALSTSNSDRQYELILNEYDRLQDIYNTIQSSPAVASHVNPVNYSDYINTYRNKVAEKHLEQAESWINQGTKRAYREAYNAYTAALRYQNTSAIKQKRDDAYNQALTKVLVVPIQNYGGYSYNSSYQLQQFQNDIMRTLTYNINDNFVKFYSDWDLRNKDFEPDQILEMNLGRLRIGQPYDERSQREVSKQVVIKEIVYKPDSVVKQYGTVTARITSTRRTLISEGELYITFRDTKGRILWNDRFTGQHRWQTEFATYTGDDRALSESDKSAVNRQSNYNTPSEEEIMGELYRQIQADLSGRLRNYFSRY